MPKTQVKYKLKSRKRLICEITGVDYATRSYLSSIEAAKYLGITIKQLHELEKQQLVKSTLSGSGQKRYDLADIKPLVDNLNRQKIVTSNLPVSVENKFILNKTTQTIYCKDASGMKELESDSIHLMITSPPYFNTKMYSRKPIPNDLANIHDINKWFELIGEVWREVFRVLQPGRKAFINIMNLPIRENGSFRSLNLVGRTIEVCEKIGFIFKRDIIWHKTNGVRAHFGSYPYPGGILLNNMHEFILEFNKPNRPGFNKYGHLSREIKEESKIDKKFWLSIKNTDVWLMKPEGSGDNRTHIAPFPYELPYRLIKAYSYISEMVLDPFAGSGTTLSAAADLGRNGIGYEINPEIATLAIHELKAHQFKIF